MPTKNTTMYGNEGVTRQRTEAQREAARRNGTRSRGPKTPQGKARSRTNALKHGLFARQLTPPDDSRQQDELYRQYHRELSDEFCPTTFSEEAAVSRLASQYLQLARVQQMIEMQQQPRVSDEDEQTYKRVQHARQDRELLADALQRCGNTEPYYYERADADRLAELVARAVAGVYEELAEAQAEDALTEEEMDEQELNELRELKQAAATFRPRRHKLQDRDDLKRLFAGDRRSKRGELERIRLAMQRQHDQLGLVINLNQGIERRVAAAHQRSVEELGSASERLMLLQQYLRQIERSIERLLSELRGAAT